MMKRIGNMVAVLCHWIKGMIAMVTCHRAMYGLAAGVYGALALGLMGKEAAAGVLCAVYVVIWAKG